MSLWSPDSQFMASQAIGYAPGQAGLALVVSLVLLLVLTAMGVGLAYVASVQSDLVAAVVNKPLSIDASETCFDNAVEWLTKPAGQSWVNGLGAPMDLAATGGPLNGKTVLGDTIPVGQSDSRSAQFQSRAGRAAYSSCIVEKISSSTNGNSGNEIGSSNGYGASSFVYVIRITSIGSYNVAFNSGLINPSFWQSNSSKSVLEAVVQYTP
jgi:Tfp pilus assembly protein PilX